MPGLHYLSGIVNCTERKAGKKARYLRDGVERTGLGMTITDAHASDGDVFNGIVVLKRQAERWRTHSDEYDSFNHILSAV